MAITLHSDFQIREDFVQQAATERFDQAIDQVTAQSAGGIVMNTERQRGFQNIIDFFPIAQVVSRRDLTSTAAQTATAMPQTGTESVKILRKVNLVEGTLGAFRTENMDPDTLAVIAGRWHADQKLADMLNTGILALEAFLDGEATNKFDATGASPSTLTHPHLNSANAKLQDRSQSIVSYLVHGVPAHQLIGQAITDAITDVANIAVIDGRTFYLGRPGVVTDSPALINDATSIITFNVLGLQVGALTLTESEQEDVVIEVVTGGEQLTMRYQAEFAYNIRIKGATWDTANGGDNPTDAAVGTSDNWDSTATSFKDFAGVHLEVTD